VYCAYSTDDGKQRRSDVADLEFIAMRQEDAKGEASKRLAALARAERPRPTKESIELAKPHPWSNCDE
jgi:hypothetical protein